MKVRLFLQFALLLASALLALPAAAQLVPQRPLTLVVPYPPGGPLDNAARILAEKVGPMVSTTVVVDNKPGAGGNIGAALVARAPADGHTLVLGAVATHAINPWLYASMPYDALKDFTPITRVAQVPNVLVMPADAAQRLGIRDLHGLIDHARKNPGRLNYASGGNGSAGHLAGELFKSQARVSMVHIPYAGAAPAQAGLLAGQTDLMFDNLASASANIKAGRLIALGVTSLARATALPGAPAISEVLPGFEVSTWFGIFGPARLPQATVDQLHAAFAAALGHPDTVERFARMGATPSATTPAEFAALVQREHARYGQIIKGAGIRLE
ncbi:MAG TPA: tripartite tricarboxylate transporter substrate binding protein [Burkholderiaceae bacterium]|nr:tripartite tricarboxylate transporter substrate binding protein [Burkholderiaceae bacterium]